MRATPPSSKRPCCVAASTASEAVSGGRSRNGVVYIGSGAWDRSGARSAVRRRLRGVHLPARAGVGGIADQVFERLDVAGLDDMLHRVECVPETHRLLQQFFAVGDE